MIRQPSPQFVDYSILPRQYSPTLQNYDIMWQPECQFRQPVYDPPVNDSYSQYYPAVSYQFNAYDNHQPNGYVDECMDTNYVTRRPVPQCENYDERRWHGASNTVACSRLRVSKRSRSFARRHRGDSSRFQRRRRRSGSSRRESDVSVSESMAADSRRGHGPHAESAYSTESEQRSRHTRHHRPRQRRRYSSSSSSSRGHRSSMVSESMFTAFYTVFLLCRFMQSICFLLGTSLYHVVSYLSMFL